MRSKAMWIEAAGIAACVLSLRPCSNAAAGPPQDVYWLQAQRGDWIDPTKWSSHTFYPQNGQPSPDDRYRAIINASGAPYEILMDRRFDTFALDACVLDAADVTLRHVQGTFRPGLLELRAGVYSMGSSEYAGTIEDAIINIEPRARFDFATYPGNPWQATGQFRRCTINGDLTLSRDGSGVLFDESVNLSGSITLEGYLSRVWFAGTQFRFDNASIVARKPAIIATSCFENFIFGSNARLQGEYMFESRGAPGRLFTNEGQLEFSGASYCQKLAVDNRGSIEIRGTDLKIYGEESSLANHGRVEIGPGADFVINAEAATINTGRIALATGSTFTTLRECRLTAESTVEFTLKHGLLAGQLDLGDARYQSQLGGIVRIVTDDPLGFVEGDRFRLVQCENYIGMFSKYELPPIGHGLIFQIQTVSDGVFAVVTIPSPEAMTTLAAILAMPGRRRR